MTSSSLRRSRGYKWESEVVRKFQEAGCGAWRLGGTTVRMPDVLAVEPTGLMSEPECIYGVECKSTRSTRVYFPGEQIQRCRDMTNSFGRYKPVVVLASFFARNARKGTRLSTEYLYIWHEAFPAADLTVSHDGKVYLPEGEEAFPEELCL